MYALSADVEYVSDALPNQENWIEICNKHWRPNEHLYFGPVPKIALSLPQEKELTKRVVWFYDKKLWKIDYNPNCSDMEHVELKDFCKFCWLLKEYYTEGFHTHYSAHYNPRTQEHTIHPGGGRKYIDTFFAPGKYIEMFYFNTMEVEPEFLQNMRVVTPEELDKMGYECSLVADHGSIIPHVFYGEFNAVQIDTTQRAMDKYLEQIKIQARDTGFDSNFPLPEYIPRGGDVYIEFQKKYTDFLMAKAVLLGVMRIPYEDKHIRVRVNAR